MFRYLLASMALASMVWLAGCETGGGTSPLSKSPSSQDQARLAAYAASTNLPSDQQGSNDLQIAATVNKSGDLTIQNFSDQNLQNANVWVNGAFVRQVGSIPAHSNLTINRAQFYNKAGMSLTEQGNMMVQRVQVQTDNHLYNVQGPQMMQ